MCSFGGQCLIAYLLLMNIRTTRARRYAFLSSVHRAGFKIVWSPTAVVHETVSRNRANSGGFTPSLSGGNSWVLVESTLDKRVSTRFVRVVSAWTDPSRRPQAPVSVSWESAVTRRTEHLPRSGHAYRPCGLGLPGIQISGF